MLIHLKHHDIPSYQRLGPGNRHHGDVTVRVDGSIVGMVISDDDTGGSGWWRACAPAGLDLVDLRARRYRTAEGAAMALAVDIWPGQ